jgi:hypothetical protein
LAQTLVLSVVAVAVGQTQRRFAVVVAVALQWATLVQHRCMQILHTVFLAATVSQARQLLVVAVVLVA